MTTPTAAQPNRLIHEKSPYLQQHAYNPVDWYPWGPEAFEKAKKEDKPILISIGYSTCHWCHVMERESYENPEVAALMNKYLVNIKVDREERPDIDKIYMTAVTAMTGSGGWPLNVFVTPDLKPFFGGTYFPPTARWGHPGWSEVVKQIGTTWQNTQDRQKMLDAGNQMADALKQYARNAPPPVEGRPEWLDQGYQALLESYDAERGGFGSAPKFPMPVYHNFLLRYWARSHNEKAQAMSFHTLKEMAKGGLYDQLGGGFARYSTDSNWHIPHFEKMLYDNAQLAVNYLEAYQISRDPEFRRIARETLDYIARDMTSPEGGFYSAEDADSLPIPGAPHKVEGAFYVWGKPEIINTLGSENGEVFCFRYGVREMGNAAEDPHGEFTHKNILYIAHSLAETARHFNLRTEEVTRILDEGKQKLLAERGRRPRPPRDDKILSAWNGLMISAYARAYQVLGDEKDLQAAEKAATFILTNLYDAKNEILYRRWRDGQRQAPGIADDYAFFIQALLDLYESNFKPAWLDSAIALNDVMVKHFYDETHGGFFMTAERQDPNLLIRIKEDQDNVEPSASSVAALNLLRLAQLTDKAEYRKLAQTTLQAFGATMKDSPRAMPQMLVALDFSLTDPRQVVIVGKDRAADTNVLFEALHEVYLPVKVVMFADGGEGQQALSKRLPFIAEMKPLHGRATAYVCEHYVCKEPTSDPQVLKHQLGS